MKRFFHIISPDSFRHTAGRLCITLLSAMACAPDSYAQQDMLYSQSYALPTLYNPAAAGSSDRLRLRGMSRMQWIGIKNAPKSFGATADMPFRFAGNNMGVGVAMTQESLGLFSNLHLDIQGAWHRPMLGGTLDFGIQAGYYNSKFRGSEIYIPEGDDFHQSSDTSLPNQDLTGNAFDLGAGIGYTHNYFSLSLSALHLTSPTVSLRMEGSENAETAEYQTSAPATLYFQASGNIPLKNTLFEVQPYLIVASDLKGFAGELALRSRYNRMISAGIGYRWQDAISITGGVDFKDVYVGYAFDWPLSVLGRVSGGSHELVIGYRLKLNFKTQNRNRHRSIRIM